MWTNFTPNKILQSDQNARYALILTAEERRYNLKENSWCWFQNMKSIVQKSVSN